MSDDLDKPSVDSANPLLALRRLTPARIALGRTGTSLPTSAQLDFQYAHAQARDAVHLPFDPAGLSAQLAECGYETVLLHSAATTRDSYLQRPDLGRKLSDESAQILRNHAAAYPGGVDLVIVVADGLSALAVHRHTVPFLARMREQIEVDGWTVAPVILVEQGRVAVSDEIGELLGAKMVVILIGER
ncbi:MAG: ethanolamine ammonia-lyase light chain, partial [Pseudomonas sp.]|nr:ethanolamine ammonia-lyase light chain [Pseudomonas sp.]